MRNAIAGAAVFESSLRALLSFANASAHLTSDLSTRGDAYAFTVTVLHDIRSWLPVLETMLEDAPASVRSVQYTAVVSERSVGWSALHDREPPAHPAGALRFAEALRQLTQRVDRQFGAILRADRSGRREVTIVELPECAAYGVGGKIVGDLVREFGALPALYRREATPNPAAQSAPSADPEALAELVRGRMPAAEPAPPESIDAVEAELGVALPDEVRALYMAAGRGWLVVNEQPASPDFYGMDIVPLDDVGIRASYLPENRLVGWGFGAIESLGPDPTGRVQALAGSPLWFPVGTDGGGNLYCADLLVTVPAKISGHLAPPVHSLRSADGGQQCIGELRIGHCAGRGASGLQLR